MKNIMFSLAVLFILSACTDNNIIRKAVSTINPEELREYTRAIGADSLMGRKPFTEGEKITVRYLAECLSKIGFAPAFGDSYYQEVPMVEIYSQVKNPVIIKAAGKTLSLLAPDEIAIISPSQKEFSKVTDLPMVFCGFGIVAPEYGWNDYSDLDVNGKCAVVLVNDPGLYTGDSTLFKGRAMTYYGRWTYKYEEAARQGASAILIIHETTGAGYNYSIPRKSSISARLQMEKPEGTTSDCEITGWLPAETAAKLFDILGYNVDSLRMASCKRGYKGFEMKAEMSSEITNSIKKDISKNVAGILKGSSRQDEAVIITAHWDHFGIGEKENGDSIYNGTIDNGTSIAWALEIGKAFSSLKKKPERSIIILFPTAEEEGLLGSSFFVSHSPVNTVSIAACFNNDMLLPLGRMKDIMVTGYGQSDLEEMLASVAASQDRYIQPDPTPETGMYFRSDHFPFAKAGIPSLFARGNCDSREHGKEWAAAREKNFLTNVYHKPADNYSAEMNFEGIAEDAASIFEVAYKVANSDVLPSWKSTSEFAGIRKKGK